MRPLTLPFSTHAWNGEQVAVDEFLQFHSSTVLQLYCRQRPVTCCYESLFAACCYLEGQQVAVDE
eukprot:1836674-Prymnesium_polylepis.1